MTESTEREHKGVGYDAHFYLDQIEKYQGGRNDPTIQLRAAIEHIEAELARWTPAAAPQAPDWIAATPADTVAAEYGVPQAQSSRSEKMRDAGFTRRPSPPGKMAGGIWRDPEDGPARSPEPAPVSDEAEKWRALYRRAVNEANGLTNYVGDRPELRRAERNIEAIEADARALLAERGTR